MNTTTLDDIIQTNMDKYFWHLHIYKNVSKFLTSKVDKALVIVYFILALFLSFILSNLWIPTILFLVFVSIIVLTTIDKVIIMYRLDKVRKEVNKTIKMHLFMFDDWLVNSKYKWVLNRR